jgi:hypothetical protein
MAEIIKSLGNLIHRTLPADMRYILIAYNVDDEENEGPFIRSNDGSNGRAAKAMRAALKKFEHK